MLRYSRCMMLRDILMVINDINVTFENILKVLKIQPNCFRIVFTSY